METESIQIDTRSEETKRQDQQEQQQETQVEAERVVVVMPVAAVKAAKGKKGASEPKEKKAPPQKLKQQQQQPVAAAIQVPSISPVVPKNDTVVAPVAASTPLQAVSPVTNEEMKEEQKAAPVQQQAQTWQERANQLRKAQVQPVIARAHQIVAALKNRREQLLASAKATQEQLRLGQLQKDSVVAADVPVRQSIADADAQQETIPQKTDVAEVQSIPKTIGGGKGATRFTALPGFSKWSSRFSTLHAQPRRH